MVPVLLNIHHLGKPQALLEDQTVRVSQEMENSASFSTFSSRIFISSGILQVEWSQILSGLIVIFHNILNREAQVTYHSLSTR